MRFLNSTAGRLSRHRRSPLAGLAVLLIGLFAMGGLYSVLGPAQAHEGKTDEELISQGRELFIAGCSSCHGENGEGITTVRGENVGPSLIGVGAAAVDFQVSTGRMPMAAPGPQAPRKRPVYSEEETLAMAAYVASLGPGPGIPTEADYSLDTYLNSLPADEREAARQEAIRLGGEIFLSNCSACHNFEGSGGAMPNGGYAPNLHGVDEKHIYEAMLTGPHNMPSFSNGSLTQENKRDVIAYLKSVQEAPGYGGFSLGGLGPVSEGLFAWVLGIGGCVGFAVWIAAHTTRTDKKKVSA